MTWELRLIVSSSKLGCRTRPRLGNRSRNLPPGNADSPCICLTTDGTLEEELSRRKAAKSLEHVFVRPRRRRGESAEKSHFRQPRRPGKIPSDQNLPFLRS